MSTDFSFEIFKTKDLRIGFRLYKELFWTK